MRPPLKSLDISLPQLSSAIRYITLSIYCDIFPPQAEQKTALLFCSELQCGQWITVALSAAGVVAATIGAAGAVGVAAVAAEDLFCFLLPIITITATTITAMINTYSSHPAPPR